MHVRRLVSHATDDAARAALTEMDEGIPALREAAAVSEEDAAAADRITDLCDRVSFDFCLEQPESGSMGVVRPRRRRDRRSLRGGRPRNDRPRPVASRRAHGLGRPPRLRRGRVPARARPRRHAVPDRAGMRALILHAPGDLRLEDVPEPTPGRGRRAPPGRGRAHGRNRPEGLSARAPGAARPPAERLRSRGRAASTSRRVAAWSSRTRPRAASCPACARGQETLVRAPLPAPERRVRGAAARARADRAPNLLPVPPGLAPEVAAMAEPLACCLHGIDVARVQRGDTVAIVGLGPIGLMLCACVADAGGRPVGVGSREERRALAGSFGAAADDPRERRRRDRGGRNGRGLGACPRARAARAAPCSPSAGCRARRGSRSTRTGSTTRRSASSAPSTTPRATSAQRSRSSRAARTRSSAS